MNRRVRTGSLLLLAIVLPVITGGAEQKTLRQRATPASTSNDDVRPQLLNADANPTLRFPIARMGYMNSSLSFGWLDISRASVRYHVEQPPSKAQDSFETSRQQVRSLDFQGIFLTFSNPKLQRIFYLPPGEWASLHSGTSIVSAAEGGTQATQSILRALQNFDFALSLAQPPVTAAEQKPIAPVAGPAKPAAPVTPPNIVLTAPASANGNQPVEMDRSPLVIRGAAMDAAGIPVVTINGLPANMKPQSNLAAEFWSDPQPLQPGDNRFQISAIDAAHGESHVTVLVHYTPKATPVNPRALAKQDIVDLLHGDVPAASVVALIKERGIKFRPTADDLNAIRACGGNDELIQAIQQAAPAP